MLSLMRGAAHLTEKLSDEGFRLVFDAQTNGKQRENDQNDLV